MSSSNAGSVCEIRLTNSNGETKSPDNQKTSQERAGVAIFAEFVQWLAGGYTDQAIRSICSRIRS